MYAFDQVNEALVSHFGEMNKQAVVALVEDLAGLGVQFTDTLGRAYAKLLSCSTSIARQVPVNIHGERHVVRIKQSIDKIHTGVSILQYASVVLQLLEMTRFINTLDRPDTHFSCAAPSQDMDAVALANFDFDELFMALDAGSDAEPYTGDQ